MASDAPLVDLCVLIADCPHSTPEWTDSGVVVLRSNNIRNGRLSLVNASYTNEAGYQARVRRATPIEGDIVITREAPMGEVCMVPSGLRCCLGQRMVLLRPDRSRVLPDFLLYALQSQPVQDVIQSHEGTGSTVSNLRIPALEALRIPIAPMDVQARASSLLKALDDRIDLLRSTNGSLEQIARVIFKSWFVDFDPVRAKAEGREPEGMDAATASLFPSEFVETETSLVPKGWIPDKLGSFVQVTKGKSYKSTDLVDSHTTALVTLKSFLRGGGFNLAGFKPYSGSYKASQVLDDGDVVIAYTDVTQAGEVIGRPAVVTIMPPYKTLVASLDVGIVRSSSDRDIPRRFIYGLLQQEGFQSHVSGYTSGTTVLHLASNAVADFLTVIPSNSVLQAYERAAAPMQQRQMHNMRLSKTLSELRDTLLPRLISGKLRVPEAEKILEAVR
jgi:type I restriction enzyme, S subunit